MNKNVERLINNRNITRVITKDYVFYRHCNRVTETVTICRMDRKLFEELGSWRYIPQEVLIELPLAEWESV